MVSFLLLQYVFNSKEKSSFFITALFFALLGDLLFNIVTPNASVYAMGSFLIFNLFMMILVTEKAGEIKLNLLLLYTTPFMLIFFIVINFLLKNVGVMIIIMSIYGIMLVLLCSFCLYYLVKTKSEMALYFFLGSLLFVLAGLTKVLKDYYGITVTLRIINNLVYTFSLYFYYKAMVVKRKLIDNSDLQEQGFITY